MKKIGLLTTLLVCGLLLTGCDKLNSEIDEIRTLELAKTQEGRIELCNNKILAEVDSGATNFVGEEVIYSEGDEDSRHSDNFIYFSGSNGENKVYGCGLVRYGKFINLYPVDQDFLNSEEYQQLGELREMLTVKDEESKMNESEITTINSEIDNAGWDWTNTSESNNYYTYRAKIVRTGNIHDYRNEKYGFQLTLPESWNDCMIAHNQSVNNETNKIEYESFQLICPWENVGNNMHSYIPEGYDNLVDIIVIGPDTDEWTLNSVSDQKIIVNNKYKFGFGISDASKDIFDGKVSSNDLECGKYPNCTCLQKESYQIGDFWDNVPNNYQEIGCFITSIVKDHIEVFDV